nr:SIS domain-containing protein [uncultured Sphaerochaeta sp.]
MDMMDYINEQIALFPQVIRDRANFCNTFTHVLRKVQCDRIYLVASGTSKNATAAAAPFMERMLGISVTIVESSRAHKFPGMNPLVVFISQGGASTNTIAAIERCGAVSSLAMTGNPESKINRLCDHYIAIPCGEETVGPKTKGYTITILALYLMALEGALATGRISEPTYDSFIQELIATGRMLPQNIRSSLQWVERNKDCMKELGNVYVVGKECGFAAAQEGALKILETLLIPAFGFEFEEYLHGPTCSLKQDVGGMYFLPPVDDPDYLRMQRLVGYHRSLKAPVFAFGSEASADEKDLVLKTSGEWYTTPFEYIIPMQVLSYQIPIALGVQGQGSKRFRELDDLLGVKSKN